MSDLGSDLLEECVSLLESNHNLILTGAPGTGKSFLAKEIANKMGASIEQGNCEFVQFHQSYDYTDFVEGLRPVQDPNLAQIGFKRQDGIFKAFCKKALMAKLRTPKDGDNFEESWFKFTQELAQQESLDIPYPKQKGAFKVSFANGSNEDIEVIKTAKLPMSERLAKDKMYDAYKSFHNINEMWASSYKKGVLNYMAENFGLALSKSTDVYSNQNFVFIIDEINRGEISKILGELFFCIEPSYRGEFGTVKTQYQNLITDPRDPFINGFYIPDNVYIIGTMNDIDRSVDGIDFAMHRRFAWKKIKSDDNLAMLDVLGDYKDHAVLLMRRLNNAIYNEQTHQGIAGLSADYHLGGAYFSKLQHYLNDSMSNWQEALQLLWSNHLEHILLEYLKGSVNVNDDLEYLRRIYFNLPLDSTV